MRRDLSVLAIIGAMVLAVLAAPAWFNCVGTFSWANYERIRPGMTLAEVERLVGRPGVETFEGQLPGTVDWDVPVDHPKRVKAVVSGERYYRWDDSDREIIISLRGGVVAEKWYWEPSF